MLQSSTVSFLVGHSSAGNPEPDPSTTPQFITIFGHDSTTSMVSAPVSLSHLPRQMQYDCSTDSTENLTYKLYVSQKYIYQYLASVTGSVERAVTAKL